MSYVKVDVNSPGACVSIIGDLCENSFGAVPSIVSNNCAFNPAAAAAEYGISPMEGTAKVTSMAANSPIIISSVFTAKRGDNENEVFWLMPPENDTHESSMWLILCGTPESISNYAKELHRLCYDCEIKNDGNNEVFSLPDFEARLAGFNQMADFAEMLGNSILTYIQSICSTHLTENCCFAIPLTLEDSVYNDSLGTKFDRQQSMTDESVQILFSTILDKDVVVLPGDECPKVSYNLALCLGY